MFRGVFSVVEAWAIWPASAKSSRVPSVEVIWRFRVWRAKEFCWLDWIAWGFCCLLVLFVRILFFFLFSFFDFDGYKIKTNPLFIRVLGAAVSRRGLPGHVPVLSDSWKWVTSHQLVTWDWHGLGLVVLGWGALSRSSPISHPRKFSLES